MRYWLFKSEPSTWSWQDQIDKGAQGEEWDGVRNYQARNMMRDDMKVGDKVFFYHSACKVPGVDWEAVMVALCVFDDFRCFGDLD